MWTLRKFHPKALPRVPVEPKTTGGEDARKRAEEAIEEMRERHKRDEPLMAWLRADFEKNHYAQRVSRLFQGGRP